MIGVPTTRRILAKLEELYAKGKIKDKKQTFGKNPGDVWGDIKQLTYKSKELVST